MLDRGKVVHAGPSRDLLDAPERLAGLMGVERRRTPGLGSAV